MLAHGPYCPPVLNLHAGSMLPVMYAHWAHLIQYLGIQANGHAQPPPNLMAAQDFPSLGAAPAAGRPPRTDSPGSALVPGKTGAWANGGGAAIRQASQSLLSLGAQLIQSWIWRVVGGMWLASLTQKRTTCLDRCLNKDTYPWFCLLKMQSIVEPLSVGDTRPHSLADSVFHPKIPER